MFGKESIGIKRKGGSGKQKLADTVVLLMRTRVVCFEVGEFEFDLKKENKKEKDSGWTVI